MTTPQPPRWYSVNNMGMATLCADQDDAEDVASACDMDFPRQAPHRAVQLVEVSGCGILRDEILIMAREAGLLTVTVSKAVGEIRKDRIVNFANVVTATERAARIEAQRLLADAQELAAKSGLAHRKAESYAMKRMQAGEKLSYTDKEVELIMLGWQSELQKAVAAEREACAVVCDELQDVPATEPRHCAQYIRARGTP